MSVPEIAKHMIIVSVRESASHTTFYFYFWTAKLVPYKFIQHATPRQLKFSGFPWGERERERENLDPFLAYVQIHNYSVNFPL